MAIGKFSVYPAVIASGVSTSAELDLGRGWSKVYFDNTGGVGSTMFFVAEKSGGTYRQLKYAVASGMSAPQTVTVGSATSGSLVEVTQLQGFRFVKVATDATVAGGVTLNLHVADI